MSLVTEVFDLAAVVVELDLGEPDDREHLVRLLQERRAEQLEALLAPSLADPTSAMLRLRATRWEEITVCEAALLALGAPFEEPTHEPDREERR